MPELKSLPMPAWHGTPANLVQGFIDFVRNGSQIRLESRLRQLRDDVEELEYQKRRSAQNARSYRATITAARKRLTELNGTIVSLDDLSRFDEGLIGLMEHPSVIGIRADSGGRLVVHLRLFKPEVEGEEEPAYVGDFEVYLLVGLPYEDHETLPVTQTDDPSSTRWSRGFADVEFRDGVTYGTISFYGQARIRGLLAEGRLPELIDTVAEQIVTTGVAKRMFDADAQPTDPTWSGITSDLEKMLARTIEISVNRHVLAAIRSQESCINEYSRYAKEQADSIRSYSLRLTRLRSELTEMERIVDQKEFDEEAAREQLRYITSLKGVMGIQFTAIRGKQVPTIHVRTSTVYDGERYDLGDYELMFVEYDSYDSSAAVIRVNRTRAPMRGQSYYYHPGNTYGSARYNWFCFGNRAEALRQLFRKGEFGEFVHMAINSLNSINSGDQYNISYDYERIPMNATWTPPVEAVRPRRRRRLAGLLSSNLV